MKIRTKVIALALASALAAPNALAVEGSDGMHYTSASEGFYASVRVRFNSGGSTGSNPDANSSIGNQSSRLGVQGTGEMSHGLEGFYRYEAAFSTEQGSGFSTRLGYVGVRGGFGSFRVGSDWADSYNWVTGSTDIANVNSGNFNYNDDYAGRSSNAFHYQSPDFNGLQVAARFEFDGGSGKFTAPSPTVAIASPADADARKAQVEDSELDAWALSARYSFGGFAVSGTYRNNPDYILALGETGIPMGPEDKTAWAVGASYGQDNWNVATWYGENNASDYGYHVDTPGTAGVKKQDETVFSVAGNVTIGKSGVYVVHESKEDLLSRDDSSTAFGIEYRLNSKAKTWIEYAAKDYDSDPERDDYVTIGLRHDF